MNERERYLKAIEFREPDRIPYNIHLSLATWYKYKEGLEKIVLKHPKLFPHYKKGDFKKIKLNRAYQKGRWKDIWGILWDNTEEGLDSAPVEDKAPLGNWESLANYQVPDPLLLDWFGEKIDWEKRTNSCRVSKYRLTLSKILSTLVSFVEICLWRLRG